MIKTIRLSVAVFSMILMSFTTLLAKSDIKTIEVRVLPESVVYNKTYTLGDIAEFNGFDVKAIQSLAKLEIGQSPLPGRSYVVSHGKIRYRLNTFDTDNEINIIFPSRPIVSRASIKISKEQIEKLLREEILRQYRDYENVKFQIRSRLEDVFIPKGKTSYEVERIGNRYLVGGNSTWTFKLFTDNEEVKKLYVRVKVEVFDEVLVARDRITKGEKIDKSDLTPIMKDISNEKADFKYASKPIIGKFARRDIHENETVKRKLVEKPVLVEKGDPVKLIYRSRNMVVTNIVKALKSGKKGDVIPVRTFSGDRTIYAVIIDSNIVEVAL